MSRRDVYTNTEADAATFDRLFGPAYPTEVEEATTELDRREGDGW